MAVNSNRAFLTPVQLVNQFNCDATTANAGITLAFDPDSTSATYSANAANAFTYRMTLTCTTTFRLPGWADTADPQGASIQSMYFNLNQRLGFANQYLSQQYTGNGSDNTVKAPSPPNLQRTSCIYVRCSLGNDTLSTPLPGGGAFRDLLLSIPTNALYGDIVIFKEPSATGRIVNHTSPYIRTISITLLDDQFNPLGLPDNAISSFEFDFLY